MLISFGDNLREPAAERMLAPSAASMGTPAAVAKSQP